LARLALPVLLGQLVQRVLLDLQALILLFPARLVLLVPPAHPEALPVQLVLLAQLERLARLALQARRVLQGQRA
jgi:hypothetical protein